MHTQSNSNSKVHLSLIFYFVSSQISSGKARFHRHQSIKFLCGRKIFVKSRKDFEPNLALMDFPYAQMFSGYYVYLSVAG